MSWQLRLPAPLKLPEDPPAGHLRVGGQASPAPLKLFEDPPAGHLLVNSQVWFDPLQGIFV